MEQNKDFQAESTSLLPFDPIVIIQDICKRWVLILVLALIVGMAGYVLTDITYRPVYKATSTLVVTTRSSTGTVYSNLNSTSTLASVFSELLGSSVFRTTVLEESGLENFSGTISAAAVPDTNLLTMTVTADHPRTAFLVAQAVLENHGIVTYRIVGDVVVEVLQPPAVPILPANPSMASARMKQLAILTAVLTVLALGWSSYARDMVRSAAEARKKLDCWYLGEIPHEQKNRTLRSMIKNPRKGILITDPATSFHFLEIIQKLRHRVEQHMGHGKVLMVTSLLENEGKSTVAANLALAMAKKHSRVLLMDCDLRKPACATLMNIHWTQPGVRDILNGKVQLEDCICQDRASGLYLLLEYASSRNSGDLLGSRRMEQLLACLRQEFDYIILDLPPMSAVTDAETVMELADASLLVVCQNAAPAGALNKALEVLNRGKARMLGCVLNNVYTTFLSSGQGYGTYGSYGRYGKYGNYGRYGKYGAYQRYTNQER